MFKIFFYSVLLSIGLVGSQLLPLFGNESYYRVEFVLKQLTLLSLAYIMIHVGLEFQINKNRLREYGKDYFVAFITATLPWIFCSSYFVYSLPHEASSSDYQIWTESLLLGRFAAPTSAGVLFTMLAGAGLAGTWVFRKARILAIFDDLDTILLMIPLKMLIVGMRWELSVVVLFLVSLLVLAWKKLHSIRLPLNWQWVLLYSTLTVMFCEGIYLLTKAMAATISIHLEVLLPAFVIGCVLAYPNDNEEDLHKLLATPSEKRVQGGVSAVFMLLVGLSMPPVLLDADAFKLVESLPWWEIVSETPRLIMQSSTGIPMSDILFHVFVITVLSNLGKMAPAFFYSDKASLRERLSLALGMCPRGEVGAGIIVVSLSLVSAAENPMITIAMLSLALNLLLTGPIIVGIKSLLNKKELKG